MQNQAQDAKVQCNGEMRDGKTFFSRVSSVKCQFLEFVKKET